MTNKCLILNEFYIEIFVCVHTCSLQNDIFKIVVINTLKLFSTIFGVVARHFLHIKIIQISKLFLFHMCLMTLRTALTPEVLYISTQQ